VAKPADTSSTCPVAGQQNVLIILASYPSKALLSSVTPQLMQTSFFGTGATVDAFMRESSFGQTWLSGDVVGPFVLDADYFDEPLAARDAALRAAAPGTDLTKYSRIVVVGPQGQMGMDSGGMALIGCGQVSSPQGDLFVSSIWLGAETMVAQDAVVQTGSHEMGHGFGLEHARWADYGAEVLGPAGQEPAPWDALHDYGDFFSNMGRNSGQWAAPHKALLGWLGTTNIQTVTANGTFTVPAYEVAGSGQTLKISRDGTGTDWLWLEYRQPQGTFDATLNSQAFAGAMVHYQDPGLAPTSNQTGVDASTYTNLVNFHPSAGITAANDPTLHVGESWTDPYGNLSLTVNSANSAGLNVTVSYAAAATCPSSVGAAQAFTSDGGNGTIPVTAASGCSWTAAASVPWITVGTPGSGAGNGSAAFAVAANPNVSPRWGKVTIGGRFVVVTQSGSAGYISLSPQSAVFSAAGGTGQVAVSASSPDVEWETGWNATWITSVDCLCLQDVGSGILRYTIAANSGPQRTAVLTIGGLAFTITQQAGTPNLAALTWTNLLPVDAPSARVWHAMAPWGASGLAILYGGTWNTDVSAETWLWNGSNWALQSPVHSPEPLADHAMAYDPVRGNIVLFGGARADGSMSGDTWVFNGTDWQQMQPATNPPARWGHVMAYDPVAQAVVMFGGTTGTGDANDTWTWNGTNWTAAPSTSNPSPRQRPGMAFDATRNQMVLYGGFSTATNLLIEDTWLHDATGWHQAPTPVPPPGRMKPLLAYHPGLHAVVMVGGVGGRGPDGTMVNDTLRETWLWDGQAWTQQFPENQPGAAYTLGAAWDPNKQGLIVHLGDDLTCASRGPKTFLLRGSNGPAAGVHFVPVPPCRVVDTRRPIDTFGGPNMTKGETRSYPVPQSACGIPATALAYSLNATVLPHGPLSYLSLWPTGDAQPVVSTLNSFAGQVVANAALVPAGIDGAVSVFATDPTDLILDINGYFDNSAGPTSYSFYAATPCRVADTRSGSGQFGAPAFAAQASRAFSIPESACSIPATASAYSLNFTAVPSTSYLGYLTTWPTGQAKPNASTLNSWLGKVVANAAIVPAGSDNESVSVFVSDAANVIMDINGYFGAPGGTGALNFYPVTPCRAADTRFNGPKMGTHEERTFPIAAGGCNIPSTAQAYSLNFTVVPDGFLGYLSTWPTGSAAPVVSTLNSWDGSVVANAAIVPAGTGGSIEVLTTNPTEVIIDINGYFAP